MGFSTLSSKKKCSGNLLTRLTTAIFPYGFKTELKDLLVISWPIMLTVVLQFTVVLVSTAFCGHIGKDALDGVGLANSVINMVGTSVMLGMATSLETLLAQLFGSEYKKRIGLVLQRGFLVMLLAYIPIATVLLNTEHILVAIGQNRTVARLGGQYTTVLLAGVLGDVGRVVAQIYLQSQNIVFPSLIVEVVANILNVCYHYIFIFVLDLGVIGAGIAVTLTFWTEAIICFLYVKITGMYKETWSGFSKECLTDWKEFLDLAVPGIFLVALEWWSFEIFVVISGLLGEVQLAAQTVMWMINSAVFSIFLGLSIATCVKVGNHVGAGNVEAAITTSRVAALTSFVVGSTVSIFLLIFKDLLPKAFSSDPEVIELISSLMPLMARNCIFDSMQITLGGVIRGIGYQTYGAFIMVLGHYVVALPIGIPLALCTSLQVSGIWLGLLVGLILQCILYGAKILSINWKELCEQVQMTFNLAEASEKISYGLTFPKGDRELEDEVFEQDYHAIFDLDNRTSRDNYISVLKQRFLLLISFVFVLAGGIILRVYLDKKASCTSFHCFTNSTMINSTVY